jgi:hypothetical protein
MLEIINLLGVANCKRKREFIIEIQFKTLIYKKKNVSKKNVVCFHI